MTGETERLDITLVERGIAETRSKAQAMILAGDVIVDGQMVDRAGKQISASQTISLTTPGSSASTGISIFIDSRITRVSPSATSWPTSHSTFQTVPVM